MQHFQVYLGIILLLPLSSVVQGADKLVIAHRGASGYLPEHTLEAKVLAFAQGADYLEQDVVMTRDDQLVVFHDLTLERMTNVASLYPERARADGSYYVIDFTLAELRRLTLHEGSVFPGRFPTELGHFSLHTLAEELELVAGLQASTGRQVGIYPELKSPWFHHQHGKDLALAVFKVLQAYGYDSREDAIFVQSFDHHELVRIKRELLPSLGMDLKLVQLIAQNAWNETMARDTEGVWQPYDYDWMFTQEGIKQLAEVVDGLGPAWDMLLPATLSANEVEHRGSDLVQWAHAQELQVHPYTFRREASQLPAWAASIEQMLEVFLYRIDVDGVFTDFPDLAREVIAKRQ